MSKRLTTEIFIKRAKDKHGNKYDYTKTVYINKRTEVCITCPEHGEFYQIPYSHINGYSGCTTCNGRISVNEFIKQCKNIHNNKYNYSNVNYTGKRNKICIICPMHGKFHQIANDHLNGCGCIKCANVETLTTETFINKANVVHNNKYEYTKCNYINNRQHVVIICPEHGEFTQQPKAHLNRQGCPLCYNPSNGETSIRNYLIQNDIGFIQQHKFDGCKSKRKLPFDFYIPTNNILIEFDGIQHFKPINQFGGQLAYLTTIKHDILKTEYCTQYDIKLLRIPYWDIDNVESILQQSIFPTL